MRPAVPCSILPMENAVKTYKYQVISTNLVHLRLEQLNTPKAENHIHNFGNSESALKPEEYPGKNSLAATLTQQKFLQEIHVTASNMAQS